MCINGDKYEGLTATHAEVVPCDQLDKVVVEGNASTSIKDGGVSVTVKVCGHNLQEREADGHVNKQTDQQITLKR